MKGGVVEKRKRWMIISGAAAFTFFLVANFTDVFIGLNILSGCIQVTLNVFVFVTWLQGYRKSRGFGRFVAFVGLVFPPITAGITIVRVLAPWFISF